MPPGTGVGSGLVWPPIEGRRFLQEAGADRFNAKQAGQGRWVVTAADGWIAETSPPSFANLDEGREELLAWARRHHAAQRFLSPARCLALCEGRDREWRLWQVVKKLTTLKDLAFAALAEPDADDAVAGLVRTVSMLLAAARTFEGAPLRLEAQLDLLAVVDQRVRYGGMVPLQEFPSSKRQEGDTVPLHVQGLLAGLDKGRRKALRRSLDAAGAGLVGDDLDAFHALAAMLR